MKIKENANCTFYTQKNSALVGFDRFFVPTSWAFFIMIQDESMQMVNIKVEEGHFSFPKPPAPAQKLT